MKTRRHGDMPRAAVFCLPLLSLHRQIERQIVDIPQPPALDQYPQRLHQILVAGFRHCSLQLRQSEVINAVQVTRA